MFRHPPFVLLAAAAVTLPLAAASAQHSPYAGEQDRDTKSNAHEADCILS